MSLRDSRPRASGEMEECVTRLGILLVFVVGAVFWGVVCFVAGAALRFCL